MSLPTPTEPEEPFLIIPERQARALERIATALEKLVAGGGKLSESIEEIRELVSNIDRNTPSIR